jgi:uncharacterized protein Yka (UPF0111/DUF47 family)
MPVEQELLNLADVVKKLAENTQADAKVFYAYIRKHEEKIDKLEKELMKKM